MKITNKEILHLVHTIENYFEIDMTPVMEFVKETNYEYNKETDMLELYSFTEISDIFRRNIYKYNDIFSNNNIKHILLYGDCVFYYDNDSKEYRINNENIKIRNLDLRTFGKFSL